MYLLLQRLSQYWFLFKRFKVILFIFLFEVTCLIMRVINGLIAAENNLELLLALATIRDTGKINYVRGYITWLVWNKDKKKRNKSILSKRSTWNFPFLILMSRSKNLASCLSVFSLPTISHKNCSLYLYENIPRILKYPCLKIPRIPIPMVQCYTPFERAKKSWKGFLKDTERLRGDYMRFFVT